MHTSQMRKRLLVIGAPVALLAFALALALHQDAVRAQETSQPWDPSIAQVVAVGYHLPSQNVLYVEDTPATFTFEIKYGDATFTDQTQQATVTVLTPGWLVQPEIIPGPLGDDSVIDLTTNAVPAADTRSIYTTTEDDIDEVFAEIPPPDPCYLDWGDVYYVMDLRLVASTTGIEVDSDNDDLLSNQTVQDLLMTLIKPRLIASTGNVQQISKARTIFPSNKAQGT